MKLRSAILFGCLLIVPLVAMFSHKIPRGVREGFRDCLWKPAAARLASWVVGESDPAGRAVERSAFAPISPAVPASPVASPAGPASASPQTVRQSESPPVASTTIADAPPVPPAANLPAVTLRSTLLPRPSRGSLDERLAALGAVGLKVKPPDGPAGVHVASCRVPADASGQLQRLFHASGPTPETSIERLAAQIEAWRSRLASADGGLPKRDAVSTGASSVGPSSDGRRR